MTPGQTLDTFLFSIRIFFMAPPCAGFREYNSTHGPAHTDA